MDKYVKHNNVGVVNLNNDGYLSAKRRKTERKRLEKLYQTVEELERRIETLENLNK